MRDGAGTRESGFDIKRSIKAMLLGSAAICLAAALAGETARPAQAQAATAQAAPFDIRAQDLGGALASFADRAGLRLLFASDLVAGRASPGISGSFTPEDALDRLLAGTGLTYRFTDASTVTILDPNAITDDGALVLDTIDVEGRISGAFGEENRFVAADARTATKLNLPIIETPASVSVVTRAQIEARDAQTTAEALRYTPGVRVMASILDRRNDTQRQDIRGFSALTLIDGTRNGSAGYTTSVSLDPYLLDRIEVLSGPASVIYGEAAPGGAISFMSKRPTETPLREVIVGTGNYGRLYGAFDLSGPVNADGKFLYRLTGVGLNTETQVDHVEDERIAIAPAITWKPSDDTNLTLLASYQYDPAKSAQSHLPWAGSLKPNPNGKIPTSFFAGEPDQNYFKRHQFLLGYEFDHRFNDIFAFRQNTKYIYTKGEYIDYYVFGHFAWQPDMKTLERDRWGAKERVKALSVDNQIETKFDTGTINHTLLTGLEYFDQKFFQTSIWDFGGYIDYTNPEYGNYTPVPAWGDGTDYGLRQIGLYAQDAIRFDNWRFVMGIRQDWAETWSKNRTPGAAKNEEDSDALTYRLGVAYAFDNGITPYANYSTSFQPQSGSTYDGERFDPTEGKQFEIGIKYQPPGMESFFQLSAWEITQKNVLTGDDLHPGYSVQLGEIRSRGITPSVTLSLSDSLDVMASYTYLNLEQTKASNSSGTTIGNVPWFAPEHVGSGWANYTFQEGTWLAGLKIGAGIRYVGSGWIDNGQTEKVPSHTLTDATISYDFGAANRNLKGLHAQINVQNLFDKTYVDRCTWTNCWYGDRRTITAQLKYTW